LPESDTMTQDALARALKITRPTLREWQKRDDWPTGATLEQLIAWRDERGLGRIKDGSLGALKAELMRRDIELRDLKLGRERGNVVEREVVQDMLQLLSQKLDLLLRLKLEVELGPRVAGKSAAEANVEGGLILDEIREVIAGNLARFETEAIKKSATED
jgi:transcriptional regulator with XRE-family HTH domain